MRFHVTMVMRDTIVLDDDKRVREVLEEHLPRILESEKVQDSGLLCGKRGAFFIVEVDAPEELFELLGPEIYANFETDVQPLAPLERIGELFQQWGPPRAGRLQDNRRCGRYKAGSFEGLRPSSSHRLGCALPGSVCGVYPKRLTRARPLIK
jgi:hypothetical protein